jgi:hypothetical protein
LQIYSKYAIVYNMSDKTKNYDPTSGEDLPAVKLHDAIARVYDRQADWQANLRHEGTGVDTSDIGGFLLGMTGVISDKLEKDERREDMQPAGRAYLTAGFAEDVQHLQGLSQLGGENVLIHVQRIDPERREGLKGYTLPEKIDKPGERPRQATELITVWQRDGLVSNYFILPKEADVDQPDIVTGFDLDLPSLGWNDQTVLTLDEEERWDLRDRIRVSVLSKLRNFPEGWQEPEPARQAELAAGLDQLQPVEY